MTTSTLTKTETVSKPLQVNLASKETEKPIPNYPKYKFLKWEFETPIIWVNVFFITLYHIIGVYGFVTHPFLTRPGAVIFVVMYGSLGGFGVTGAAHRYFTHRAYKAKLPLRIILLLCFSISGQNQLKDWVRDHRVHHKYSETDADPHNAKRGFFFSHVGWLMMRKHPEVIRKGRTIDISDLYEDPLVILHQKYFTWLKLLLCFVIPIVLPPYLYGETWYTSVMACFTRYIISLNSTWAVNSAAHLWGNKPYDKRIYPAENLTVSFFSMGEGYHNYHHTFPWDYRTSEMGKSLNVTTFWLNVFQKIGWAYDMKTPSTDLIKKVIESHGDGSHYKWGHEVPAWENDNCKLIEKKL
ncbi:acyl-CoA Delta-9 desaturase [Leptinotarsa decemlineata]|uniref:acyl-CoA Delta-9 desaturase n=1 Tax=Leptinotarsa decemlineata TaxID=7539 RepID=UPI000C25452F|nr:acyl-CoA Delta(11) desaturase-like [Leptinotarsa decemlineata]XP_023020551.1 acyl-CoA Delta(11) desaturase-like [Leptinotarsa decemlineata]